MERKYIHLFMAVHLIIPKSNYERVLAIYNIIEAADASNPLPELSSKVKDEYGYIIQNMIKVFIESRYIKAQLSERKSKYEAMELLALQSQINPHFLFNTLETINWGIVEHLGITNHVSKMLENLSDVLKYSLRRRKE
ncbi:MAG: integral rane sensor signal transduction histidine kinase [Anaerocolumna sp.]|nr:integral rane sensor signal transduction histidine kinase [Anaerocolumna sp.]